MGQGDLFRNLMDGTKVWEDALTHNVISAQKLRDIQAEIMSQEMNIAEQKRNMLASDYKGANILKRIASSGSKILKQTENIRKVKKGILNTEKDMATIQARIKKINNPHSELSIALKKQYNAIQIINQKNKIGLNQMRQTIPVLSKLGKYANPIVDSIGALQGLSPIFGGLISSLLKLGATILDWIIMPFKEGFKLFLETQKAVGNLTADIGLTVNQSRFLLNNIVDLNLEALKFGGTMEDVINIFRQFSDITNKNRFFNKGEISQLIELGKGTGLGVDGAAEIAASFDNIGISLEKTINLTDKARNLAARFNVNTTKVLKTYQGLVNSLTGIGFGKGLDNLTKLATKALAIRFDIESSTKSFSDAFFDPEKAVEAAAKMQVLGGKFSASFGDPMQLAFESMNDPSALAEKFAKSLSEIVKKDANGNFFIPPAERKMLKLAAENLGQDYEMAVKSAIEQGKIADKMASLNKSGFSLFNISPDDRPALASLMKLDKNGNYTIQLSDGSEKLLDQISDKNVLMTLLNNRKKNDLAAQGRMNLVERIENIINRFTLGFTNIFQKFFAGVDYEKFLSKFTDFGEMLAKSIFPTVEKLFNNGGTMQKLLTGFVDSITAIVETIAGIFGDDNNNFSQKLMKSIGKLVGGVWDLLVPYLKAGMGELLIAIGSSTGFDTVKVWGEKMLLNASAQNQTISDALGQLEKKQMAKHVGENKNNLTLKQMGGVGAAGALGWIIASALAPVTGGLSLAAVAAGSALAAGGATYGAMKYKNSVTNVDDALITPHGIVKGDKGDMWMALQAGNNPMDSNTNNGVQKMEHSGVITLMTPDGKTITWDQFHGAADMFGSRLKAINESHNGGFGNYGNGNNSPISPLI